MFRCLPPQILVTGGAGFVGSHLVDALLAGGHRVAVLDNFSTGQRRFLARAVDYPGFRLVEGDLLDPAALRDAMDGCEYVFHLAANADIRFGLDHPERDLEQNTLATFRVLECMRGLGIKRLSFSSTAAALGEPAVFPTPEDCPLPLQTSLYGAAKMACEGLVSAYGAGFGFEANIYRFVSLLGDRYPHGHVFDFCKQLFAHPDRLRVLGDGKQRKSYLAVGDCVSALLHVVGSEERAGRKARVEVYHLGSSAYCELDDSIGWICDELGLDPTIEKTGGSRGWIGDSPFVFLDTTKLTSLGWAPTLDIEQAVRKTVNWLSENRWLFEARA